MKKQNIGAISKALRELVREIWANIVPSKCPYCSAPNPKVRKEGFTKFFRMDLPEKEKAQLNRAYGEDLTETRIDYEELRGEETNDDPFFGADKFEHSTHYTSGDNEEEEKHGQSTATKTNDSK